MRHLSLFAALPVLALTACGGSSGPETAGSIAPPTGGTGTTPGATPTPTAQHFLDVTAAKTWDAVGSFHSLNVKETGIAGLEGALLYAGNASTVRGPSGQVTYNPRDGIFTVNFVDTAANVELSNYRFQDPAHRTSLGGRQTPQWGVPTDNPQDATALRNFNFLEGAGPESASDRYDAVTFFYQRPGAASANGTSDGKTALHVSIAGYVRNAFNPTGVPSVYEAETTSVFQRGAFVFGDLTARSQVPVTGTASYRGDMIATMVGNNAIDSIANPTNFQWIVGSSNVTLDFGKSTMAMMLTGTVTSANMQGYVQVPNDRLAAPAGSIFTAQGSGKIDLAGSGGFTGQFDSASINPSSGGNVPVYNRVNPGNQIAGGNSIDGAFFGPNGVNVGGNFRIVGGVPDQRIDIHGAFTGVKQ